MWGCVFEDFLAYDLDDGSNIVDDYLKRRGWKESVPNKQYMKALRSSVMSLYEVSDVVRDQSFLARDLLRGGEPIRINEKSATHSLKQWEEFAALRKKMLSQARKSDGHGDEDIDPFSFDTTILGHAGFLFTNVWLEDALQRAINPRLPTLSNSDGDEIAFTTVRYPLKETCNRAALEAALTALPDLQQTGDNFWTWTAAGAPATGKPRGADDVITSTFSDGSISMGSVELEAGALMLETNSSQRAQRGRALLEPVIGPFVGEPVVASQTMAEMHSPGMSNGPGVIL
jgi:hypothetical protein